MKKYYHVPVDIVKTSNYIATLGETVSLLGKIPFTLWKIKKIARLISDLRAKMWSDVEEILGKEVYKGATKITIIHNVFDEYYCHVCLEMKEEQNHD